MRHVSLSRTGGGQSGRREATPGPDAGFTLFELLFVLIIAAGLFAMISGIGADFTRTNGRSEVMRLSGAIRYAYSRAAINGWRYDVVLNAGTGEYRIECSERHSTVEREIETESATERAFGRDQDEDMFEAEASAERALGDCSTAVMPSGTLDHEVKISRILTTRTPDEIVEGPVHLAMFPDGTTERAVLWIEGKRNLRYTIFVDDMTGRVTVETGEAEVPDDFFEVEED